LEEQLSNDVIVVRNLLDADAYEHLLRFMDERVKFLPLGLDDDNFVRTYAHNPPYLVNVHRQLTDFASEVFGIKLKPSYVFLSMYKENGICPLHIDRPQCFRTIDLLIRSTATEEWPIRIGKAMTDEQRAEIIDSGAGHPKEEADIQRIIESEEWTDVNLNPNDAVLYSGTNQWHYRPHRLKGTADLVFFHFVPEDFNGPLS
jgi:hypothetical protein